MIIYKLDKIKRDYGGKVVLEEIDLSFEEGKIYAIVGENGSGKTTLLETLAMLEPPQEGKLSFYRGNVEFQNNLNLLSQKISFCMQQPFLFKTSVSNNVAFGLKARGINTVKEKVESIAQAFGLSFLLNKKVSQLSGGEAQKVALARTFVIDTPVILLDEPTANLDETSIKALEEILIQSREKGKTVIFASHQLDIAFRLADEVVTLKDANVFPQSHQNFFTGKIQKANGLKTFIINERVSFVVASDKLGKAKVSIDPREIIVSKEKFESSARNCLFGKVVSIIDEGNIVKLTADCGIKLVSQITHKSLEELGINVAQEVFLTFKTSSIRVY
jgi:molybdopterin-binding protein